MVADVILEAKGLTKEFKGFFAVNNVDLAVRRHTIHALIGPNGAGKTTCFNLLTHFLVPTAGRIRYNGRDITGSSPATIARMKSTPADDPLFGKSVIRADGRKVHDVYLFEVKSPAESKGPWDYYKLVRTIPGDQAFRPMDQGECPLVKK